MFTKEKAAQYLIVGWCKNWRFGQYLQIILEGDNPTKQEIMDAYPFLPKGEWYIDVRAKTEIKPIIAKTSKILNDKLFDANSDLDRLKLASELLKINSTLVRLDRSESRMKFNFERKRTHVIKASEAISIKQGHENNGYAWNIVK